jgi:NAD(P)-dependent dehydrogenase (short-subunit alcohol dehydrogenase family)
MWCFTKDESIQWDPALRETGFLPMLYLTQAIGERLPNQKLEIKVFSNHLEEVTGEEVLAPAKAPMYGPCRVLSHEYPHLRCTCMDMVLPKEETAKQDVLDGLCQEIKSPASHTQKAYRGKHSFVQTFESVPLERAAGSTSTLREKGVYLITGGLGGIGSVVAECLAETVQAKMILLGRSKLPERSEWDSWLRNHGEGDAISRKIEKIRSFEKKRAEVLYLSADVAEPAQMEAAFSEAKHSFGRIHGVIHAAGLSGDGIMQLKTAEKALEVMRPKIQGTLILDRLLRKTRPDFLVLCSSTLAFLGYPGQVDYCGANAFLDAYASLNPGAHRIITINWCAWKEVGMAAAASTTIGARAEEQDLAFRISPEEGKEAFLRILDSGLSRVVVSTQDFQALFAHPSRFFPSAYEEKNTSISWAEPKEPRPILASDFVAPGNETEKAVAEIWQDLLGVEKVGVNDNFFELGGHSLLATQVIARLKMLYPVELSHAGLIEHPTVGALSQMILDGQDGPSSFEESQLRGQKRKEKRRRNGLQGRKK